MAYAFYQNSFAPKCPSVIINSDTNKIHSVSYNKCNFSCEYCFFKYYKDISNYKDVSEKEYEDIINEFIKYGNAFKFTGGEPTLNPHLVNDLKVVKKLGGIVYLDTNGLRPEVIESLLREQLVDYFGISLKGLSVDEAVSRSGIQNGELCWERVFQSMDAISRNKKTMIVTYVVYDNFTVDKMEVFADILKAYPEVYLKINNFQPNKDHAVACKSKEKEELRSIIQDFLDNHLEWKGRITLVENAAAIEDVEKVGVY